MAKLMMILVLMLGIGGCFPSPKMNTRQIGRMTYFATKYDCDVDKVVSERMTLIDGYLEAGWNKYTEVRVAPTVGMTACDALVRVGEPTETVTSFQSEIHEDDHWIIKTGSGFLEQSHRVVVGNDKIGDDVGKWLVKLVIW